MAAHADVTLTFDSDLQGVVTGSDSAIAWSAVDGGSLAITTAGGYKRNIAYLNLGNAAPPELVPFREELLTAISNGGTLSYTITVKTTSLTGGTPGWFETTYGGNSTGGYETAYGGNSGELSLYNAFPLAADSVKTVTHAIENGTVINDSIAQFSAGSSYYEIHLGLNSQNNFTSVTYYIDNIKIAANVVAAPPPVLAIRNATPGLHMISSAPGRYNRQAIRTVSGLDMSWVGKATPATPVSYAWTIKESPPGAGYESLMYLIPGSTLGANASDPDYTQADAIQLLAYPNGDGTGSMSFRYKVNSPASNGPAGRLFYNADLGDGVGGQITSVSSTKFIGTWKCTFTSDVDFTLTTPDGATSSGALHPSVVDDFTGPMYVYFGNIPSQVANIGLAAVYSRAQVTGTPNDFDEDFSSIPFTSSLEVSASSPASVFQVTPEIATYFLDWTIPANGFTLQQSVDLGISEPWQALPFAGVKSTQFGRTMLLPLDAVLSQQKEFIRMVRPGN